MVMNINTKLIIELIILAFLLICAVSYIAPHVSAHYYVQQGDTIYLGDTVDISGVGAGVLNFAWYGGYDEESGEQYLLKMPVNHNDYYSFYVDPAIFGNRLHKWYKWNGYYESNGNTLAFIVMPERTGTGQQGQETNVTLQNPNQTAFETPVIPLLPIHHISDYLIARGDNFNIPISKPTKAWIFGARDSLYDYYSFNGTIGIPRDDINTLSPGLYTLLLQTHNGNDAADFEVRYNPDTHNIEWFNSTTFQVNHYSVIDQTPENILTRLELAFSETRDSFNLLKLEVQEPTISIDRIDAQNALNNTRPDNNGVSLDAPSYLDVRGYTNVAPDTIIKLVIDPNFDVAGDVWRDAIATSSVGTANGDMREFKAIVPIDKYGLAAGRHFVGAKAYVGNAITTADFYIYDSPIGTYIPNKTIRYVSGRYGDQEIVPTPTPVQIPGPTQIVTVTVTIPVTPPPEEVAAAQRVVAEEQRVITDEKNKNTILLAVLVIIGLLVVFLMVRFLYRGYKRKAWIKK